LGVSTWCKDAGVNVEAEFERTEEGLFAEAMQEVRRRTPARCPACRSRAVVPLILGYPMLPAVDAAERGEVALGGCMVGYPGGDPEWECADCGHWWRSRRRRSEAESEALDG
jgi:hypothetical protein